VGTNLTKALCLDNSYLKECDATVVSVKDGTYVVLDQTIFYPKGGGQPSDTGEIVKGNEIYNVVHVGKFSGWISHEVDRADLQKGDIVHCLLDWERRYKLMRSHTAAHVFASLLCTGTGALVTGNQLEEDKVRFDFSLEEFNREIPQIYIDKANEYLDKDIAVKWYTLPREDALRIPGVIKMAQALPPEIPFLRIVEVVGVDMQVDGGTHVKNLSEVGQIELIKVQNKGKYNRRVYFRLK
jgi:misacylated tRNA(Ala) deacylase